MIDYENFRKSLKNLELQNDNYLTLDDTFPQLNELMREGIAESVIQRFEVCYDTMWKVMKRYLVQGLGIPEVPNSPNPIFRLSDENNLLPSPIERWMEYSQMRIDTSHDYSGEKAKRVLERIGGFIQDAVELYETLSGDTWK